ncbi:MAG: phage tail assembly chaperone [Wohlfahrtiimonas sp.]
MTGAASDELQNPPQVSPEFAHIWDMFTDLNQSRINYVGMSFAYASIRFTEIKAYLEIIGKSISKDELDILLMFDDVFLKVMNEVKK